MWRMTLRITYGQRRAARIGAVAITAILALVLVGAVLLIQEPTAAQEVTPAEASALPTSAGRHVYLTKTSYPTNQAKTACAAGYHMASLWEILDISNLIYDSSHPQAYVKADSGWGPPAGWHGWVRTGYDSSASSVAGTGNCRNWTSVNAADYGVSVRLAIAWETFPGDIGAWDANEFPCNFTGPVWCVADIVQTHLPFVSRQSP